MTTGMAEPTTAILRAVRSGGRQGINPASLGKSTRTGKAKRAIIIGALSERGFLAFTPSRLVASPPLADEPTKLAEAICAAEYAWAKSRANRSA